MSQYLEPHFHLASINFLGFVEKFPQIFHFLYQSFDSLFRNFLLVLWFRFELQKFRKLKFFAKASAMTRPVRMIRFLKRYDLHVTDRQLFAPQKGFKFIFYIESKFFIFREIHIIFTTIRFFERMVILRIFFWLIKEVRGRQTGSRTRGSDWERTIVKIDIFQISNIKIDGSSEIELHQIFYLKVLIRSSK